MIIINRPLVLACVLCALAFSGCATVRHPVPKELLTKAEVGGMDDIRMIGGMTDSKLQKSLLASIKEEAPGDYPPGADGVKEYPILAISGGASNGAYGAGLLKGWSAEGTRPKFKAVTGVSTGAIIAPFVFLGKDYDDDVETLYTTMSTKDVASGKGPLRALMGDSLMSNKPLERHIKRIVTDDLLAKVAAEHKKGRRLYVGTTNLDAQQFVVWDMGAIAARGDRELFGKVILASAAIPVIFPPVFIHVEADGKAYDEMHVDGGTMTQVFSLYQLIEPMKGEIKDVTGIDAPKVRAKYYIIRNGYVSGVYKVVKDDLADITGRAFDSIINSQGIGDTYRIYTYMKERGNDYYLAYIPADFTPKAKEMFDIKQMKELFDKGYQDAVKGYKWHNAPPGLNEPGTK
jgi:predicted acylesterase/phospholipase RssA